MRKRIISERYASALLEVARKKNEMGKVSEEMMFIAKILEQNPAMKRFLESPHIPQEDKEDVIRRAFSPTLSRTLINFLLLLVKKYRVRFLKEMIEEYQRLYDAERAIQRAEIITAYSLEEKDRKKLKERLEGVMEKTLELSFFVNPEIIGGVIVRTPNMIIDGSIRRQLFNLSYTLKASKMA